MHNFRFWIDTTEQKEISTGVQAPLDRNEQHEDNGAARVQMSENTWKYIFI